METFLDINGNISKFIEVIDNTYRCYKYIYNNVT